MTDTAYIDEVWARGGKLMHWKDGIGFERLDGAQNGDVRITRGAEVIAEIPAAEWCSLVHYLATCSGVYPSHVEYQDVQRLHAA